MKRLGGGTIIAAISMAAFVGCGGNGGPGPVDKAATSTARQAQPERLSNAQLVKRMNTYCDQVNSRVSRLRPEFDRATETEDYPAVARVFRQMRAVADPFAERMFALKPDSAEKVAFAQYTRALRRQSGIVNRQIEAADEKDFAELVSLGETLEQNNKARLNAALDLGADRCGRSN